MIMFGNFEKCYIRPYREHITGQKTWTKHRYYKSCIDPQIQLKVYDDKLTLISTQTNNILEALSTIKGKYLTKFQLVSSYKIKDLGKAKFILEMQKQFNMSFYLPTTTSLSPSIVLSIKDSLVTLDEENKMKNTLFWEALGLLM